MLIDYWYVGQMQNWRARDNNKKNNGQANKESRPAELLLHCFFSYGIVIFPANSLQIEAIGLIFR